MDAASIRDLFDGGNYAAVAMAAEENLWQTHAARGLIGQTSAAVRRLRDFDDPEARYYEGVAHWIGGRRQRALKALKPLSDERARVLADFVARERIRVLGFLPWTGKAPHDHATVARSDRHFDLRQVRFPRRDKRGTPVAGDAGYHCHASVHELYDAGSPPDFVIAEMIEWHLLPEDLREIACPLLGHTADFDLHIQAVYPFMQAFDELLVTDPTEWAEARRLVDAPVTTFPKVFGLADKLRPIPSVERTIDLFQSGSVTHPYHPDKARLLHELLEDEHLELYFLDGFAEEETYFRLVASSKAAFTYIRHPGAMPTRGLEALAMGSAVAVQEGSSLTLYAGEEQGVFTYGPNPGDLAARLREISTNWESIAPRAQAGARQIRGEFAMRRVAAEYMRYCTHLAARQIASRDGAAPWIRAPLSEPLEQKRTISWKGWMPSGSTHEEMKQLRQFNFERFRAALSQRPSARVFIDIVREMLLEYVDVVRELGEVEINERYRQQVFSLLGAARGAYPENLVLRFLAIRAALHYGRAADQREALALIDATIARTPESWSVDPLEDVMPWDFFATCFNYRGYLDACVAALDRKDAELAERARGSLAPFILASILHYRGRMLDDAASLEGAVQLDPEFPFYRWELARCLIGDALHRDVEMQPSALARAGELLEQLCRDSLLVGEAERLLVELDDRGLYRSESLGAIRRKVERLPRQHHGGFWAQEGRSARLAPSYPRIPRRGSEPAPWRPFEQGRWPSEIEVEHEAPALAGREILVSAIVSTYKSERFMRGLLEDLEAQSIAERLEIIVVDSGSPEDERSVVDEFRRQHDNIVYIRTRERESSHAAISRGCRAARGRYIALANTDDRHDRKAFARLAAVLDARPDISVVYADNYVTVQANETFERFTRAGHVAGVDYHENTLLQRCIVGPEPMWRRSVHERYGYLDPSIESAGDWEFWLRITETEALLHVDETLGLYYYSPTSSERRDPERKLAEVDHIRDLYAWRAERRTRWQQEAILPTAHCDEPLIVVYRTSDDPGPASRCVDGLRAHPLEDADARLRLARASETVRENALGVRTSPSLPTLQQVLGESETWQHRAVFVLPDTLEIRDGLLDEALRSLRAEGERHAIDMGRHGGHTALLLPGARVLGAGGVPLEAEPRVLLDSLASRLGAGVQDRQEALERG